MKKLSTPIVIICLLFLYSSTLTAQQAYTRPYLGGPVAIPNCPSITTAGISVSGVPTSAGGILAYRLTEVTVNISHGRTSDLDIYLRGPGNEVVELSTDNGGGGSDYTGTTFVFNNILAAGGNINTGFAPFTGTYLPEGNPNTAFSALNGTWKLEICDDAQGFDGTLLGWSISFGPVSSCNLHHIVNDCNYQLSWNTGGAGNHANYNTYSAIPIDCPSIIPNSDNYNGDDVWFNLQVSGSQILTINLYNLGADLDLFIFKQNSCNTYSDLCFSRNDGVNSEEISRVFSAGNYRIVIDGKSEGVAGAFSLSVTTQNNCYSCGSANSSCYESTNDPPLGPVPQCDDFEDGSITELSSLWRNYFPDGIYPAVVNNPSGAGKVLKFEKPNPQNNSADKVSAMYLLKNRYEGRYRLSWLMYVPTNKLGYFAVQHTQHQGFLGNHAYHVKFENGVGRMNVGYENIDQPVAQFFFQHNTWIEVMSIIDMEANKAELWINSEFIYSWTFNRGSNGNLLQLGAVHFRDSDANTLFYIDKMCLRKADCTGIPCNLNPNPRCIKNGDIYPNECAARCAGYTMDEWEICTTCTTASCTESGTVFPNADLVKCDNLNNYTAGIGVAAQTARWRKRTPTSDDATVVNVPSLGGNILKLENSGAIDPDVLFQLGNQSQGRYRLSWNMYIPAGKQAYYSINHSQHNITPTNRAYQVRFDANGKGYLRIGAQAFDRDSFFFAFNTWNEVMQIIDIGPNRVELWINGEFISSWKFDEGSVIMSEQLASINFYAPTNHLFYVDNICLWKISCGSFICQGEPPICMKNGLFDQINCADEALCLGYTPREWEFCNSVCDVGGTLIHRGDTFMGTIELFDEAPSRLKLVPEVIAAFGGALPDPLLGKIYIFNNEPQGTIEIDLPILPAGAQGFVFRCDCSNPNNPLGCDQIYIGPADSVYVNMPSGFYYIAILGGNSGNFGIAVFPPGECASDPLELSCGTTILGTITGSASTMSVANGNYDMCYNGVRAYEGSEVFLNFNLDYPTTLDIEVNSTERIGIFLFSYLCGQTCIAYAENNPPFSDTASLLNLSLPFGQYYIVLDTDTDLSPQNRSDLLPPDIPFGFSYTESCGLEEFDIPVGGNTLTSAPVCPSASDSIHTVGIRSSAFNFASTDLILFRYKDQANNLKLSTSNYWANASDQQNFQLLRDRDDDLEKCNYQPSDTLVLYMARAGESFYRPLIPYYAPINPPSITAAGLYTPGGASVIQGLVESGFSVSFQVTPSQFSPPASGAILQADLITNNPWQIIIPPDVDWVSLYNTLAASSDDATIRFKVEPNPDRTPRTAIIQVRTNTQFPSVGFIRIEQAGLCLLPEATIETSTGPFCPGDSVQITAAVDSAYQNLYLFKWNTGDTTSSITVAPTPVDTFYAIVSYRNSCTAQDTFYAEIDLLPAPAPPIYDGQMTYCSNDAPPTLSVIVELNTTVDWYDAPVDGTLLAADTLAFTPDSAGVYYAQSRSLNTQGCINPLRTPIELVADQPATVHIDPVTGVCVNNPVNLSATIGGTAATATWSASEPGGNFLNINSLNTIYNPPPGFSGNIELFLTTNDPDGICPAARDTVVLHVDATTLANAGDDATICSGATLSLDGEISGAASSATWSASVPGGQFNPNPQTLNAVYTPPPGDSPIQLVLTTNDPAGPCPLDTDTLILTVINGPSVSAGAVDTICQGGTAALNGSFGGTATGAVWSAPIGAFANPNQLNTTFTPPANFSGEIVLTLTSIQPPGFCEPATSEVILIVQPRATADAGQDVTTCTDSEVVLNAQFGGSAVSGMWSTTAGGAFSPNNTAPNAVYTPPPGYSGGIQLIWTASPAGGPCTNVTDAVNLFFGELPTVDAGSSQPMCGGGPIALNGVVGGGPVSLVNWSANVPDGQFIPPDGSGETVTYIPPGGYSGNIIFTITAESAYSNCPQISDFVAVTVSQPATALAGDDNTVCAGAVVNLTGAIGGSADSATWSAAIGSFANPNSLTTTYTPPPGVSGPIPLILTTNNPPGICTETRDTVIITVNPAISVDAGNYATVCPGTAVTLTASPSGGSGTYQYQWSNNLGNSATVDVVANFSTTYSVTLTDANGCSAVDVANVNVHFPVFVAVVPQSAAICSGTSLNLLATAVGGSGTINLNWNDGQSGTNISVSPTSSTSLIVTATDANNCEARDTVPITVFPAVSVVTQQTQQACAGQQVPLLAIAGGGSGAINYNWDNGLGAGQSHVVTLFNTTIFNVTATDTNNCSATNSTTVIITQPPVAAASPNQATICSGQSVNLISNNNAFVTSVFWTPSVSGGTFNPGSNSSNTEYFPPAGYVGQITMELRTNTLGPCPAYVGFATINVFPAPSFVVQTIDCSPSLETYSIQFQSDALEVSSPQGPVISLGGQLYRLEGIAAGTDLVIITEGANCTAEYPVNSPDCSCLQQGIQIPAPESGEDIVICEGQVIPPLTVEVPQEFQVTWFASPTGTDTIAVNTTNYIASESGTYYAETVDPVSGCVSAVRTAVSLTFKATPVAEAGENQTICSDSTANLEALTGDFYTYSWSTGATEAQINVPPGLYFLTVTLDGCTAVDSVLVDVYSPIVAVVEVNSPVLCHNDDNGALNINITGGGDPDFVVVWNTGDTTTTLSNLPAGDYSVSITDGNGCSITLSETLDNPPPLVLNDTTITDADINVANGAIDVNIEGGTPPLDFQWTRLSDGLTFDTEDLGNLEPGLYALEVTDANQCILSDTFEVSIVVSTASPGNAAEVQVFPNPTRDKLYIAIRQNATAETRTELLDMLGHTLLYRNEVIGSQALLQLDLESLPTGMYFVKIAIGNSIFTQKVTKQ